jgi:hypothetical protein
MPVTKKASVGGGGAAKSETALRTGRVAPKIECMAWNADFTEVALGIGKGIVIFSAASDDKKQWTKQAELEDAHGLDISGTRMPACVRPRVSCRRCRRRPRRFD